MPFKYKTIFENEIIASSNLTDPSLEFSKAALDSLAPLVPGEIDLEANIDLLGVAFNAAVANRFNKNHDGIDSKTALAVSEYFVHKPTNIEHRKEKVVGHVVSSGFSEFGTNKIVTAEELGETTDPFNIALAAVIYKTVNRDFAALIERSADETNDLGGVVSASWEIGFNEFVIAIGSKDLRDAEIIDNKSQIEEFKKYLKAFDGDGKMEDGTEVYRLVTGTVYPLGIGFTANPAAEVKGLYIEDRNKKKDEITAEEIESIVIDNEHFLKKLKKYKKNLSQDKQTDVIFNKRATNDMKEIIDQLKETIEASTSDKFSEEAVANIVKVVSDAIRDKSDLYVKERADSEKQKEEAATAKEEAEAKLQKIEEELAASQEKLSAIESEQKAAKASQLFNSRMESLDSSYELSDEDRKIIANDLKAVDGSDEAFVTYQERMAIVYKHKSKDFLTEQEQAFQEKVEAEVQKKISKMNTSEVSEEKEDSAKATEEVLDETEASTEEMATNNGESSEKELTLREKFSQAFNNESVTIKY
tara:strand:- start:1338 stop:2930 length:1593 start_codon:yes stop_codon:yes gene_type:complete